MRKEAAPAIHDKLRLRVPLSPIKRDPFADRSTRQRLQAVKQVYDSYHLTGSSLGLLNHSSHAMAPSKRVIVCSHTCGPCNYSTLRKREADQHLSTPAEHPCCTQHCPHYLDLSGSGIKVETPGSFAAKMGSKMPAGKAQKATGRSKNLCMTLCDGRHR